MYWVRGLNHIMGWHTDNQLLWRIKQHWQLRRRMLGREMLGRTSRSHNRMMGRGWQMLILSTSQHKSGLKEIVPMLPSNNRYSHL